jgi:hypothetical protein
MSEDEEEMSDEEEATGTEGATGAIEFEDEKKPEVDEEKKPEADVEGSETSVTVRNVERLSCDGCSTTFDSKALLLAHEGGCVQYQVKIALAAQEKKHRAEMLKQEKGLKLAVMKEMALLDQQKTVWQGQLDELTRRVSEIDAELSGL